MNINNNKPEYHTDLFSMKSDITDNINMGVFYEAPSWLDPDYYSFVLLQRILGDKPTS